MRLAPEGVEPNARFGVLVGAHRTDRPVFILGRRTSPLLVEVRVQELGLDNSNKTPVVLLQELQGERVLPIWIGPSEARAIAVQMAEIPESLINLQLMVEDGDSNWDELSRHLWLT